MKGDMLTSKDIAERYQVSANTARKYIRQMVHLENPLRVRESELAKWEKKRERPPVDYMVESKRLAKALRRFNNITIRD